MKKRSLLNRLPSGLFLLLLMLFSGALYADGWQYGGFDWGSNSNDMDLSLKYGINGAAELGPLIAGWTLFQAAFGSNFDSNYSTTYITLLSGPRAGFRLEDVAELYYSYMMGVSRTFLAKEGLQDLPSDFYKSSHWEIGLRLFIEESAGSFDFLYGRTKRFSHRHPTNNFGMNFSFSF